MFMMMLMIFIFEGKQSAAAALGICKYYDLFYSFIHVLFFIKCY